ncbi:unnamed protein product [Aphanomyces euteiches]
MASWFGHTQTVASISKSVTTVAGGIICLESNLSNFMKKVIYYEGFFQRVSSKLPEDVNYAAKKLLRRCYEYREAIREELQSSVAYVADAGRWAIGLEDWNTKMDKRMAQISELVVLANSLLAEYALTGEIGAKGAVDDLSAYVNVITSTIVLQEEALFHDSLKGNKSISPLHSQYRSTAVPTAVSVETIPGDISEPTTIVLHPEDVELDMPAPEDEDRLNPFNIDIKTPLVKTQRTEPMAIPTKELPRSSDVSDESSRSLTSSFPSDYCHLDGDELQDMTSFSTTAPRKERLAKPRTEKKPFDNAVYDLTVSFDFQKERASNPFMAKPYTERRNSLGEHSSIDEEGTGSIHENDEFNRFPHPPTQREEEARYPDSANISYAEGVDER